MTELNFDFVKKAPEAKKAYDDCEHLLRTVEKIGSFCEKKQYGNINWLRVAQVFSMGSHARIMHLQERLMDLHCDDGDKIENTAYEFIMYNCLYDNMTAYTLEAFRQKYVKNNNNWDKTFFDWVNSILVIKNGERYFEYFAHTNNPLYVK